MPNREKISCRIAVQTCIGHFPDGRERHRTFSIKDIRPDVSWEAVAIIIRALAPILKYPITKVTKIIKKEMFFGENANLSAPSPQVNAAPVPEAARIIPFVVSFSPVTKHPAVAHQDAISLSWQKNIMPGRSPPGGIIMSFIPRKSQSSMRRKGFHKKPRNNN